MQLQPLYLPVQVVLTSTDEHLEAAPSEAISNPVRRLKKKQFSEIS